MSDFGHVKGINPQVCLKAALVSSGLIVPRVTIADGNAIHPT